MTAASLAAYIVYSGLSLRQNFGYLLSNTRYKLRVASFNVYEQVNSDWTEVVTAKLRELNAIGKSTGSSKPLGWEIVNANLLGFAKRI